MFSVNDYVIYGALGLCRISETRSMAIAGEKENEYFVLTPVDGKSTVYVPIDGCDDKIRHLMTKENAEELISQIEAVETSWIFNDMVRRNTYNDIIKKSEPLQVMKVLKTLYFEADRRKKQNKKLHMYDDRLLTQAKKIIFRELSVVLDIQPEEAQKIVCDKFDKEIQ